MLNTLPFLCIGSLGTSFVTHQSKVSEVFIDIAHYLAESIPITIGQLVIVALYKGMTHAHWPMHENKSDVFFGPFWVLQALVALYFSIFYEEMCALTESSELEIQQHFTDIAGCLWLSHPPMPILENISPFKYILQFFYRHPTQ